MPRPRQPQGGGPAASRLARPPTSAPGVAGGSLAEDGRPPGRCLRSGSFVPIGGTFANAGGPKATLTRRGPHVPFLLDVNGRRF